MDEEAIKKRVTEIMQLSKFGAGPGQSVYKLDLDLYRAAYADGLEKAAKILDNMDAETHEFAGQTFDDGGKTLTVASRNIRQHAKEMGHE